MAEDARFDDASGGDTPLRLSVQSAEDLEVASALLQDAVGLTGEISWMPRRRRLALLVNRFRWEDQERAKREKRDFERVRAALVFDDVMAVRASGLDPSDKDTIFSILRMSFEPGEDGAGVLRLDLAGDGEIRLEVECLDGRIMDVSRPWVARGAPDHKLDS